MITRVHLGFLCAALLAAAGAAAAQPSEVVPGALAGSRSVDAPVSGSKDCQYDAPRADPPPKVLRTLPAPGSTVRPGTMVLSVTFDQPMACAANLSNSPFPLPCPGGPGVVIMTPDRRTLTTVCQVEAGAGYSMPLADFFSAGGVKSVRYDLAFTTSTDAPVADAGQARSLETEGPASR
jgi:hypothetical protein